MPRRRDNSTRASAVYYDRRGWWSDDVDEDAYSAWLDAREGRGLSPRERLEAELAELRRRVNRDPKHAPRRVRERLAAVEAELAAGERVGSHHANGSNLS